MAKCMRCGKDFSTRQALHYHLTKKKKPCNTISACTLCYTKFESEDKLKYHIRECQYIQNMAENLKNTLSFDDEIHKRIDIVILTDKYTCLKSNKLYYNDDVTDSIKYINKLKSILVSEQRNPEKCEITQKSICGCVQIGNYNIVFENTKTIRMCSAPSSIES